MSSACAEPNATLEQYTKDYVFKKTKVRVEIKLNKACVSIQDVTRESSTKLTKLWVNILQAPTNFPNKTSEEVTERNGVEKLIVRAEGMIFTVFRKTGTLNIQGASLLEWFESRFREVLDKYNEETALAEGVANITLAESLWNGDALEAELQTLHQGAVKGGRSYIYKLWKSLLTKWFSTFGTKVYLASPFLDAKRLADVVRIFFKYETEGDLEVFYVRKKCNNGRDIQTVQEDALQKFESHSRVFIKKNIFPKMFSPIKRFHCKFAAGVSADGQAEVLVTSANFHSNHFACDNMETVVFIRMREEEFFEKYVNPIGATTVKK